MDKFKKWMDKKRTDAKFKRLGTGHSLAEGASSSSRPFHQQPRSNTSHSYQRESSIPSESQKRAAEAAERRKKPQQPHKVDRSRQAIEAEARRQLELEQAYEARQRLVEEPREVLRETSERLAVQGVFFTSDLLPPDTPPMMKEDLLNSLESFLNDQLLDEPLFASVSMLFTLTRRAEKREVCVETLTKYLDNALNNSAEVKFRRIRLSNKAFVDRVASCYGGIEVLKAVGFEEREMAPPDCPEGEVEKFLFLPEDKIDADTLQNATEMLHQMQPLAFHLYRDPKVFFATGSGARVAQVTELPTDFYDRAAEELRKEQERKAEEVERMMKLRTKEMRERDEFRKMYRYKFALIRVRFPDGYVLQGTFRSTEKAQDLEDFVRSQLQHDALPFILQDAATGHGVLENSESTIAELHLTPAALVRFVWDPDVARSGVNEYLSIDVMAQALEL